MNFNNWETLWTLSILRYKVRVLGKNFPASRCYVKIFSTDSNYVNKKQKKHKDSIHLLFIDMSIYILLRQWGLGQSKQSDHFDCMMVVVNGKDKKEQESGVTMQPALLL